MRPTRILVAVFALAMRFAPAAAQEAARPGVIDGVVTDTTLRPLAGATVSILGSAVRVVTGENGRFRIAALVPGEHILLAQRLGFEAASARVDVPAADTQHIAFSLERATTALDTVVVSGKAVLPRFAEFETRRRNHEATASFNRDDILQVNPADTWQMLSRVSAMKLIPYGKNGGLWAVSTRAMRIDGTTLQAVPCFMSVMIDGVIMNGDPPSNASAAVISSSKGPGIKSSAPPEPNGGTFDMMNLPAPDQIHGIEVFGGPATIPPQYNGAGNSKMCGLIVIWTR
jgi:CarboxypepD_reg-like domain